MTIFRCPGSSGARQPRPEDIACPGCGNPVEIWTDEAGAPCRRCGAVVARPEQVSSCLEWCARAEECVGKKALEEYLERKKGKR